MPYIKKGTNIPAGGFRTGRREPFIDFLTARTGYGVPGTVDLKTAKFRIEKALEIVASVKTKKEIMRILMEDFCEVRVRKQFDMEGGYLSKNKWEVRKPAPSEKEIISTPVLVRSGTLRDTLTNPNIDVFWGTNFVEKRFDSVPYGKWHQIGLTSRDQPARPIATFIPMGVRTEWYEVMQNYLKGLLIKELKTT